MTLRTSIEIKSDARKQQVEQELANFMKQENEFMARERRERAAAAWPGAIQPSKRHRELTWAAAGTTGQARYYAWWVVGQSTRYLMAESDYSEDEFPSSERREKLRRDTLKLARKFPPGPERNGLRSTAKSLAFFDEVAEPKGNAGKNASRPGLPDRRGLRQGQ